MVELYNSTGGDNWWRKDNWLSDHTVGSWFGVNASSDGCVTTLSLHNNQLSGEIPPQLTRLASLEGLYLHGNQLNGEIPAELGNLARLEELILYGNQLTGEIPPELGSLVGLVSLDLRGNQLGGCVPGSLQNQLVYADLDGLAFCRGSEAPTTTAPPTQVSSDRETLVALYHATDGPNWRDNTNWLTNAPLDQWHYVSTDSAGRVIHVNLRDNQLSGVIPPELGNLASLEYLYLNRNQLIGEIPSELGRLANLEALGLSGNQLSGEIPPELGKLNRLELLYLYRNQLIGEIPPKLVLQSQIKNG